MRLNSLRFARSPGLRSLTRLAPGAGLALARSPQSLFLRALLAQPGTVGALCASSPRLAQRMAAWVDPAAPGLVLELGGGTGVITAALLARGVAPQRRVVVEQSAALAAHLQRRFPHVHVLHGDAAELARLTGAPGWPRDAAGAPLAVGCIVSGLPLLSIALPLRQRILHAGAALLAPGGLLLQFTYALRAPSPWQGAGLIGQARQRVLANLPPARTAVLERLGGG